jgi:hypothetical protein
MTATEVFANAQRFAVPELHARLTDELWTELVEGLRLRADHLRYLAAVWKELESRGEDMTRLRGGACAYLPLIASGAVLPEVVERYLGKPVCRAIASLPVERQAELVADDAAVPLAVYEERAWTHRRIPVNSLTRSQVDVVFGDGRVRDQSEQIALLTVPARPQKITSKPITVGKVTLGNGVVRIGRQVAPLDDLIRAMRSAGYSVEHQRA